MSLDYQPSIITPMTYSPILAQMLLVILDLLGLMLALLICLFRVLPSIIMDSSILLLETPSSGPETLL